MYDVVVIGGGHAGVEAAAASARRGARTALVTMSRQTIGAMSCNPAIGGVGKGHLVREVDALGGLIGEASDAAAIHYRMLNRSKGTAVQGPRVQADRIAFRDAIQSSIDAQDRVDVIEGDVEVLVIADGQRVAGITLASGRRIEAPAVVIATGTFLNGRMFCGEERSEGGRRDERVASPLADQLRGLDLPMARLKTGTPPRLNGLTVDWSQLAIQPSDDVYWTMSPMGRRRLPQLFCGVTRTNRATHDVIRGSLDRSPLYSGAIAADGPRYCPSIEDKVVRFGDRDGHQIFLEPEGHSNGWIYPNGISTSLPVDAQRAMLRTIKGLERVEIAQPGYAVEYDYIDPRAHGHHLETRALPGLFFAGQVNGTTGYEEAAGQGIVAGANAAAKACGLAPLVLGRESSYIGVMIDDLVLQGVTEPYRMLTARAEHRLYLRADNAATRLADVAITHGLVSGERAEHYAATATRLAAARSALSHGGVNSIGAKIRRGEFDRSDARHADQCIAQLSETEMAELVEDVRYEPYVERQTRDLAARKGVRTTFIKRQLDFAAIAGLSNEMIERLTAARPTTMDEAERIAGITPAALAALTIANRRVASA